MRPRNSEMSENRNTTNICRHFYLYEISLVYHVSFMGIATDMNSLSEGKEELVEFFKELRDAKYRFVSLGVLTKELGKNNLGAYAQSTYQNSNCYWRDQSRDKPRNTQRAKKQNKLNWQPPQGVLKYSFIH